MIEYFAYPYGYFDRQTAAAVEAGSYKGAFTVIPGKNNQNANRFELKRLLVTRNIDLNTFMKLVEGDRRQLAKLWQREIPEYMYRGLFLPAEIEARALLSVEPKNDFARQILKTINR